ncbi:MAG TPA: flagellar biosynthesis anti-sigma factor FlgM [Alcaligenes sp.]|nr:flagellar biosynthesis anti-sigma factor FlgM [Alcaligenes sp.]HRL25924.1 flagellar biosynthesis anti-sigma factor FlgM [Alcaligenes sp.]
MKITSSPLKTPLAERSSAISSQTRNAYGSGTAASSQEVGFSAAARQLNSLQDNSHDVDMLKVQALRDAIASGQLKVDTSRIADSLIATARDLLK